MAKSDLVNDEIKLQSNFTNRAACIFPLFNLNKTDLIFLFQNYWFWKRGIRVSYSLSIKTENGQEKLFVNGVPKETNYLSVKEIISNNQINFNDLNNGTAELSIFSKENIVFPFPAVLGAYKNQFGQVSIVHSAGRTLENEIIKNEKFIETNFFVSINSTYNPFIHIFNGAKGKVENINLEFWRFKNKECAERRDFAVKSLDKPYESKLIFLKEYLQQIFISDTLKVDNLFSDDYENKILVKISGNSQSIYPRFICGNFCNKNQFPFVTHSYRDILNNQDKLIIKDKESKSTLSLPIIDGLKLSTYIYPTNYASSKKIDIKMFDLDHNLLLDNTYKVDVRRERGKLCTINSGIDYPSKKNIGLTAEASELPARLHVNLMYSSEHNKNSFPTDIALDFFPYVIRDKFNYWSDGLFLNGFKNFIILSTFKKNIFDKDGNLKIFSNLIIKFNLIINNQLEWKSKELKLKNTKKVHVINIEEIAYSLFKEEFNKKINKSFSWRIQILEGSIQDIYCLSYNNSKGVVYGDHSF